MRDVSTAVKHFCSFISLCLPTWWVKSFPRLQWNNMFPLTQIIIFRWFFKLVDFYLHIFSSNLLPFKWKPTDRKAYNRDSANDWRDISSFTRKWSWWKRDRLIIGQEWVCLSVYLSIYSLSISGCLFVYLLSCWPCSNSVEIAKGVKTHKKMEKTSCFDRCMSFIHPMSNFWDFLRCTYSTVTLKPAFKQSPKIF